MVQNWDFLVTAFVAQVGCPLYIVALRQKVEYIVLAVVADSLVLNERWAMLRV